MKSYVVVFFLFLAGALGAQTRSGLVIGAGGYVGAVTFNPADDAPGQTFIYNGVDAENLTQYALSAGYLLRITDRLGVYAGVQTYSVAYQYTKDYIWPAEILSGEKYKDENLRLSHQMYALPLAVRGYLTKGYFAPYAQVGLTPAMYSRTRMVETLENHTTQKWEKLDSMKSFQLQATAAVGLELGLGDRLAVFAQPELRYNLLEMTETTESSVLQIGAQAGVRLHF